MSDLSQLVTYDQKFPVKLRHPVTGDDLGITFNIVSEQSERVIKATKMVENERWSAILQDKDRKLDSEQIADFTAKIERAALIACIDSWDWGQHNFLHLTNDSECNVENRTLVIDHPNAKWIRDQVSIASADLRNFFLASEKTSAPKSKGK